ncbi:recombinase [Morganella morganii]|uniref:recombinase n=1 Tax=Morganella morganii TaxID=582 RepID=UPI0027E8832C|nr:DUF2591 family protein [Morganella morganii subsp. morganii]
MNKYRDKSDFEINLRVAQIIFTDSEYDVIKQSMEVVKFQNGNGKGTCHAFDPCNKPADAMPIIKDNLISLEHDGIAWQVSCVRHPGISVWDGCENYNDNFYRKAMELFLMMKDAENES